MNRFITFLLAIAAIAATVSAKEPERPNTFYFNQGLKALGDNDLDNAMTYFNRELTDNPDNGYAYYFISAIYQNKKEWGNTLSSVNKAIKMIPKNDHYYIAESFCIRSSVYYHLGDTTKALDDISKAITLQPTNPMFYENRARIYTELKNYELSNTDYEKIISIDETNIDAHLGLGYNYNAQQLHQEAFKQYDFVISLYPDHAPAYVYRAQSYFDTKVYGKSVEDLIKAIDLGEIKVVVLFNSYYTDPMANNVLITQLKVQCKKEPDDIIWPWCLGLAYEENRDYPKAIEAFKQACAIEFSISYYEHIASCYYEMGDYKTALKYCDDAVELGYGDNADLTMIRANIFYDTGKVKEAIAEIGKYINTYPDFFGGYYLRGWYRDNMHDITGAIDDYSMSISLAPEYAYSYLGRADMYKLKGDTASANADYRKILELDTIPQDGACRQYALLELGMTDKAIEFMNLIIEKEPDDAGHYYDAACVYARVGNKAKSLEMLRVALQKGFKRFAHMALDDDLTEIRRLPEYKELIKQYK